MGAFVGRSEELRILEHAIGDAKRGRPRLVIITGEPGIGKTSLVLEVARRAENEGARIGIGRAWDGSGAPSFWLWRECFRALRETLDVPAASAEGEARFAAFGIIAERLRESARDGLVIVVLDDLQWADVPSLHALRLACRTLRDERVCIFATIREPSEIAGEAESVLSAIRREATVLALGGLDRHDLAELARASGVERAEAIEALAQATSGNTLFAIEILDDRDARSAIDEGRPVPSTRSVRDVLRRHLARLDDRDREIVAWAAVGGAPIDVAAIASAAQISPSSVAGAIDTACRERILVRDRDTLRFAHDLFRDAAYVELPLARRIEMHLAFARALGDRDEASLGRVRHLFAAHPDDANEEVARVALAAATAAMGRLAYEDAARVAGRAAEIYAKLGLQADIAKAKAVLAEAFVLGGHLEESARAAAEAVACARPTSDAVAFARAALSLGLRRVAGASNSELVSALDEAIVRLEREKIDDEALRCALEGRLAAALQPMIDPARALACARGAIARARATKDPQILARTLHAARPAFRMLEPLDERRAMDRELLDLATRLGDLPLAAHARARVFWTAIENGDAVTADLTLLELEQATKRLGLPSHELTATMWRFVRELMQGHFAEANAKLEEIESTRERWANALATTWLVDPADMMRMNLAALRGEVVPSPRGAPPPVASMLDLFLKARSGTHHEEARATFDRIADFFTQGEVWYMTRVFLGDVCARVGLKERGRRFYELCLPFEGRHIVWTPMPGYDGAADRLLGALAELNGDRAQALRHYDAAIAMEEALQAKPYFERSKKERAEIAPTSVRVGKAPSALPTLAREGETWLVAFGDENTRLKDADGLRYLAFLVERPRVPVPVAELFAERAGATGETAPLSGDAGEVLDRDAIASYRQRARDLKESLEEAEARNDRGATEAARRELAFLEDELARGVGLGGRSRRASSDHERIRVNVTTRIRKTIEKLRTDAPRLARHLEASIKTGTTCQYDPVTT